MSALPAPDPNAPWSLRRAFLRLLLVAGLLPGLLFGAMMLWNQYEQQRERLLDRLAMSTRLNAVAIDDFLEGQLAGVALTADRAPARADAWPAELAALRRHHPALLTVLATDASGRVLHAEPAERMRRGPALVTDRDYFQGVRRTGRPYISDAFRGRALGNDPLVGVAAPVFAADGALVGIVEGSIRVDTFAALRGRALQQRHFGLLLADRRGRTIYAAPELGLRFLQPVPAALLEGAVAGTDSESEPLRVRGFAPDGGDVLVGRSRMRTGWTVLLVAPARDLWAPVVRDALWMALLVAMITFGMAAAVWGQGRLLTRGLERLLETLRGVALGRQLDLRSAREMPGELRPLASAIGDLSSRLNDSYGELNAALARQRELASSLREVVEAREREIAQRTEELRAAVAELERLAHTDALTGCLNYRGFHDTLRRLVAEAHRDRGPLAVLALDVDCFKAYNDRYGHQRGDNALVQFAGAVRGALYQPTDVLARQGGEEFFVFLPGVDRERAREVGERILAAVRALAIPHAGSPAGVLTTSIGLAVLQAEDAPEDLIRRADDALYRAKEGGRDRMVG